MIHPTQNGRRSCICGRLLFQKTEVVGPRLFLKWDSPACKDQKERESDRLPSVFFFMLISFFFKRQTAHRAVKNSFGLIDHPKALNG